MYCPYCGARHDPSQRYCLSCGRDTLVNTGKTPAAAHVVREPVGYEPRSFTVLDAPIKGATPLVPSDNSVRGGRQTRTRAAGAGALGFLALLAKFKSLLVLLKLGKFTGTFLTMLVSVGAYAVFFGFPFALGIVLLLLIHEMGHWVVLRAKGVPAGAPVFIPFLGAVIAMRGRPRNVKDEAEIGIGGPIAGTAAALLTGGVGALLPPGTTQNLLYALSYVGMLLNLFNLIPVSPLDGGRVVAAISRWAWPIGLALLVGLAILHPSGIILLVLLLGGMETINRFFRRDRMRSIPGYYQIATRERIVLAIAFFSLLAVAFGGMEVLHNQLLAIRDGSV